jgi:hypothetical protein
MAQTTLQTITLTESGDYIAVTGTHARQDIALNIKETTVFDGAEIEIWTAHLVDGEITPMTLAKDTFGIVKRISVADVITFNANDQGQTWYMLKLVNAGANTNIKVLSNYNTYNLKTNKDII